MLRLVFGLSAPNKTRDVRLYSFGCRLVLHLFLYSFHYMFVLQIKCILNPVQIKRTLKHRLSLALLLLHTIIMSLEFILEKKNCKKREHHM